MIIKIIKEDVVKAIEAWRGPSHSYVDCCVMAQAASRQLGHPVICGYGTIEHNGKCKYENLDYDDLKHPALRIRLFQMNYREMDADEMFAELEKIGLEVNYPIEHI